MSMIDRNIPLRRECGLKELVCDQGRVVGAVVEQQGQLRRIRARRGVVLAAGGVESSQAMREQYLPKRIRAGWAAASPANTRRVVAAGPASCAAAACVE